MALLQVRDFPSVLYEVLAERAEIEHRSITQQTIHMLEKELSQESDTYYLKVNRRNALNAISNLNLQLPENAPLPSDLIRADREDSER